MHYIYIKYYVNIFNIKIIYKVTILKIQFFFNLIVNILYIYNCDAKKGSFM